MSSSSNAWGDQCPPSQSELKRYAMDRLDYARRHSWDDHWCECIKARAYNGHGYRIPRSTFINPDKNAEWHKATSVPCGCTCNSDHTETNRYWVEMLRQQPPEPFTPHEHQFVPMKEKKKVNWAVYYHQEQREKNRYPEERGKLVARLPAAQIAANSGSADSIRRLEELQGEMDDMQGWHDCHQHRETRGRQNYNKERGGADWSHRVAAGQGESKMFKGSKGKREGMRLKVQI